MNGSQREIETGRIIGEPQVEPRWHMSGSNQLTVQRQLLGAVPGATRPNCLDTVLRQWVGPNAQYLHRAVLAVEQRHGQAGHEDLLPVCVPKGCFRAVGYEPPGD